MTTTAGPGRCSKKGDERASGHADTRGRKEKGAEGVCVFIFDRIRADVQACKLPGCTARRWDKHPVLPGTAAATAAAAQQTPAEMQQPLHDTPSGSEHACK